MIGSFVVGSYFNALCLIFYNETQKKSVEQIKIDRLGGLARVYVGSVVVGRVVAENLVCVLGSSV